MYRGRVVSLRDNGCFVELIDFRGREGLVHKSNIAARMLTSASDAVKRGQEVWVKVISISGDRLSLSIRDVDQTTGKDLLASAKTVPVGNVDAPSELRGLSGIRPKPEAGEVGGPPVRRRRPLTDNELWELKQLRASCVLTNEEMPDYEPEVGMQYTGGEPVEEFEIDINEDEPPFLAGQSSKSGIEMSPIKIVKNPDGSLQRAAMTQTALAKERRELREQ